MTSFLNFHEAFHNVLNELTTQGSIVEGIHSSRSVGSQFSGSPRKTIELVGHSFTITNPRDRWLPCRGSDKRYAVANLFWTLIGEGAADAIVHYNPRGKIFLEDSELKCAIPTRINNGSGGSQLVDVINLLRRDPSSRRALVSFSRPEDIFDDALDFPCPSTMQFLIRGGSLTAVVNMRSQSAFGVMPYDVYLFTMIQEVIAAELGVDVGEYIHMSGSIHIYEDELTRVLALSDCSLGTDFMDRMPSVTPISRPDILEAEKDIRFTGMFKPTGLKYWDDLLTELLPYIVLLRLAFYSH